MPQDNQSLLRRLITSNVEFVIIGGVCGVLHGVSLVTFDLDICCPFSETNLMRLTNALNGLNPVHRLTPNKVPFQLSKELFGSLKNLYLQTDAGVLDCLSEVSGIGDYDEALKQCVNYKMVAGEFRILSIQALIAAKTATGRPHDKAMVKQLVGILERKGRSGKPSDVE